MKPDARPCACCRDGSKATTLLPVCPGQQPVYGAAVWVCYRCAVRQPGCALANASGALVWHLKPTWDVSEEVSEEVSDADA